ncbi:MAG: N-glycosylase/DNA lyase [Candidatus Micrarchaeia archaeon]
MDIDYLYKKYSQKKNEIESRISEFDKLKKMRGNKLLPELVFCICAANSSAKAAYAAQKGLEKTNLINSEDARAISKILLESKVRFHNNKAKYIVSARKKLFEQNMLKKYLQEHTDDEIGLRNRLADEVDGIGLKEAGHFMRNTGLGFEVAILDRHILNNLHKYGAIEQMPKSLGRKTYFEIEEKMIKFSQKAKIPMAHLDLLFWSEQTGRIFK